LDDTDSHIGGIAGEAYDASIEDCYVWVYVSIKAYSAEKGGGIAGVASDISRCYALGTVKSGSGSGSPKHPYSSGTYLGGIAGADRAFSGAVSDCMALVSEIDAGTSAASSKEANAIIVDPTYMGGNYALPVSSSQVAGTMWIHNNTNPAAPGANAEDGEARPLADFTSQALYDAAGWNFTNVWTWRSDWTYPYPVFRWQNSPPRDPATL
jgi:hypothetical protein